jgi:hypothetical protein
MSGSSRRRRPPRPPAARLLLVPVAVLALVLAGLAALDRAAPRIGQDPALDVLAELPPVAVPDDPGCTRGGHDRDDDVPARIAAAVQPGQRVASGTVRSCPLAFDGMQVTYAGELVGDLLRRDGGAWALVNDDAYALEVGPLTAHRAYAGTNSGLTVWLPEQLLPRVSGLGRPGHRGDVVVLEGTVVRTDPDDGGGLTLRAIDLEVVAPAVAVDEPLHVPQLVAAVVLSAIGLLVLVARRRSQTR